MIQPLMLLGRMDDHKLDLFHHMTTSIFSVIEIAIIFFILIHNNKSFIYRRNTFKIIQSKLELHHSLIIFQCFPFIIFYIINQNCINWIMFIPIISSNFIGSRDSLQFYALNGCLDVDI